MAGIKKLAVLLALLSLVTMGSAADCRTDWCITNSVPLLDCCANQLAILGYGCDHGHGDCDNDYQCTGLATCVANDGATFGCESWLDVCELDETTSSSSSSSTSSSSSSIESITSSSSSSSIASSTSRVTSSSVESSSSSSSSSIISANPSSSSEISSSSSSSSSIASTTSSSLESSSSSSISSSSAESSSSSSSLLSLPSSSSAASSSSSSSSSKPTTTYISQSYDYSCSREYAYRWNFTMPEDATYNTYTVNLSYMSEYALYDLSNVFLSRGYVVYQINGSSRPGIMGGAGFTIDDAKRTGNYTMYINATPCTSFCSAEDNTIYVYITGWDKYYNWTSKTPVTTNLSYTPAIDQFSRHGNTYMVTLLNEKNANNFSLTGSNLTKILLDVRCQNYSHYALDLSFLTDYGKNKVYLSTREAPSLYITLDAFNITNIHNREIKTLAGDNVLNFYLIPSNYSKVVNDFQLFDYSFQYEGNSYLRIREHISYNFDTIFSRDWYQDNVNGVDLLQGYQYEIDVCKKDNTRCYNLGSYVAVDNKTIALKIDTPSLDTPTYNFNDLAIQLVANGTTGVVSVVYAKKTGTPVNNVELRIYNVSGTFNDTYVLDYSGSLTTQTGTLQHTIASNSTVWIEATFNTSTHGVLTEGRAFTFGKVPYDTSAFNMTNFPTTYLGSNKSTLLMFASFILILTIMLIVGKATSIGYGIISAGLSYAIFYNFAWIPAAIPAWIFIIIMIFGVGVKLAESRVEVVG